MYKAIPPLKALVAFEASVRHGSFKYAAVELHVTAGAVSQHVRKLEEWLGYTLFERQIRKLKVTENGMSYYSRIAPALELISSASEASRLGTDNKVCLSLSQALAAKWLSPRLENFVSLHPDIEVHINASNNPIDFHNDPVDIAIRHFNGKDPHLSSQLLFDDEICLFCTPAYQQAKGLEQPEQLSKATLIVSTLQPFWDKWLNEFSTITATNRQKISTLHFDQALLAIDAAKRNQGVVLSNTLLVEEELKRGELIEPFEQRLILDKNYYLVHPKHRAMNPAVNALKDWLLEQFSNPK